MGKLITGNQFAFVGGRNMLDGMVIANEIVDEARQKKKPYDSVCWEFLYYMMKMMDFSCKWKNW